MKVIWHSEKDLMSNVHICNSVFLVFKNVSMVLGFLFHVIFLVF